MGFAGYPTLRLMTLAETGTRGLLGATLGSASDRDEASLARRLLRLLGPGMHVLLDRGFDGNAFFADIAATGAMLLARAKSTRRPPVRVHLKLTDPREQQDPLLDVPDFRVRSAQLPAPQRLRMSLSKPITAG
jgi:hypothetical protein